jgi:hypothetical protein
MCRNADISIALNGCLAGHLNYLSFSNPNPSTFLINGCTGDGQINETARA